MNLKINKNRMINILRQLVWAWEKEKVKKMYQKILNMKNKLKD
jgi:hypothetical protein